MLENASFSNVLLTSGRMPQSRPSSFLFCLYNRSGQERPTFKTKKNTIVNNNYCNDRLADRQTDRQTDDYLRQYNY